MVTEARGVRALRDQIRAGGRSASDVAEEALERAESLASLNIFASLDSAQVRARAAAADAAIADGSAGPLAGVPIAIKDNICTTGETTTCASRILGGFESIYDAFVVERLRDAGAVLFGKTNMDEFAMGSSGEKSALGVTANPAAPGYVPGGSSSGSAAVVAADIVPGALGSDTGGSVRQPAAFCGVVGMKPTWGRVSRRGLIAYGSSLDQIGPLTHNVEDAALLYSVIAGHDPGDATSARRPVEAPLLRGADAAVGLRVGLPREYAGAGVDPAVSGALQTMARRLEAAGAQIVDVSLPHTEACVATYYIIATAEASSNLARFDGVRYGRRTEHAGDIDAIYARSRSEGFGDEVIRRILLGTFVLSSGYYDAYYEKAQRVRTLIRRDFDAAFEQCDVMLSPTSPTPPWRTGERGDDPLAMYLADIYTVSANLSGVPAISIPLGHSEALPIAAQLMAPQFAEARLFEAAHACEALR